MEDLSHPIERFKPESEVSNERRLELIQQISAAPAALREAVKGLSPEQLDTPYRPGGWTVRQVAHHIPDSHMNAYIRFRLALTEDQPTIKPYKQPLWAELPDAKSADVEMSVVLLDGLHRRWVSLLKSMKPEDFKRTYNHPESGVQSLESVLQLYAWHGRHHVAHITSLRKRMG